MSRRSGGSPNDGPSLAVDDMARRSDGNATPLGSRQRLKGQLITASRGLIVRIDDGGVWALDADAEANALIGKREKVEGTRSGFDRIEVKWIAAV